ncbi:MAG: hypothetical protein HYX84_06885 [Chloroflexi bacterium]|nr:hypothetical protein [Chloroflexota bacterium]
MFRPRNKSRFFLLFLVVIVTVGTAALGLTFLASTSHAKETDQAATLGRGIFLGTEPLTNGGPACISCHNIGGIGGAGGGNMAKDLTAAYSKFGEAALGPILKTTPFPIMRDIYKTKPLTDSEITALVAFFKEVDAAKATIPSQSPAVYFIVGAAAFAIIIGMFQVIWRGRLSGVRQPLVKGGSR